MSIQEQGFRDILNDESLHPEIRVALVDYQIMRQQLAFVQPQDVVIRFRAKIDQEVFRLRGLPADLLPEELLTTKITTDIARILLNSYFPKSEEYPSEELYGQH
jgi:hypothetical protein